MPIERISSHDWFVLKTSVIAEGPSLSLFVRKYKSRSTFIRSTAREKWALMQLKRETVGELGGKISDDDELRRLAGGEMERT
jgi:hypothetical protein